MINHIKNAVYNDYVNRVRKFELSIDSLRAFAKLKPTSQDLLLSIVQKIGAGVYPEHVIVTGDYKTFGFKRKQTFYACRKELVDTGFIIYEEQDHYVNPAMFGYTTRRQLDSFHRIFKIKKEYPVNMGQFRK